MHDHGYELRRIPLLRTRVNRGRRRLLPYPPPSLPTASPSGGGVSTTRPVLDSSQVMSTPAVLRNSVHLRRTSSRVTVASATITRRLSGPCLVLDPPDHQIPHAHPTHPLGPGTGRGMAT